MFGDSKQQSFGTGRLPSRERAYLQDVFSTIKSSLHVVLFKPYILHTHTKNDVFNVFYFIYKYLL